METKTISINVGAFVVPNPARTVESFKDNGSKSTYEYLTSMAELNNIQLTSDDKIVQLWLHSKELDCDNINDHGFGTHLEDGEELFVKAYKIQWVPIKLLENVKEGDTVSFISPADGYYDRKAFKLNKSECRGPIILKVSMICQQKGYRYVSFGNFEEVVKSVCEY